MDAATARERILQALQGVAPEVDVRSIRPEQPLRGQIDLDSLDWMTLTDRVGEILGVRLDAARLGPAATLDDWVHAAGATRRHRTRAEGDSARLAPVAVAPPAPPARRHSVVRLDDGRRVRLRPVVGADAPLLADFVRDLSPASRYRRFMVSLRELPASKLKSLTDFDPQRHVALAATPVGTRHTRPRAWVGVARCIADAEGDGCEFAITVADEWQGSGLGGALMRAVMAEARARGHRTMHGEVLASNRPMITLARQLGFTLQRQPGDAESLWVTRAL